MGNVGTLPLIAARIQAQAAQQAQAALVQEAQITLARRELLQREMIQRVVGANLNRISTSTPASISSPTSAPSPNEILQRMARVQLPLPTLSAAAQSAHSFNTGFNLAKHHHSSKPCLNLKSEFPTSSISLSPTGESRSTSQSEKTTSPVPTPINPSANIQKLLLQKISQSASSVAALMDSKAHDKNSGTPLSLF